MAKIVREHISVDFPNNTFLNSNVQNLDILEKCYYRKHSFLCVFKLLCAQILPIKFRPLTSQRAFVYLCQFVRVANNKVKTNIYQQSIWIKYKRKNIVR